MKKILFFAFTGLALLAGCAPESGCGSSKEAFLQAYFALINEAAAANLPASDNGWKKYDERFRAYVEECYNQYEAELSGKERRLFWGKSIKYYSQRYGDGIIRELGRKKDKTSEKVKQEVEKIWEDAGEALKEAEGKMEENELLKKRPAETE